MTARYMGVRCRLLLALLGWLALADTPSAATRSSQSAAVDAIVEAALKEGPFPGISVAIEQRGAVVYSRGFGFADLERHTPVTPAIRFPGWTRSGRG